LQQYKHYSINLKNKIMKVSALDENGKPVDWWFMYKVPQLSAGAGTDNATGYEYVYYDSAIDANKDSHEIGFIVSSSGA
jgi:deoxyribonuclease-2